MIDQGIIIAITGIGIAMVVMMISMMFWIRGETNSLRAEAKEDRQALMEIGRNIEMEMGNFHLLLLEIERNRK